MSSLPRPRTLFAVFAVTAMTALFVHGPRARAADPTQLTVLFNSSVQAELHDCGCKRKPLGGLARRAAMIQRLQTEHDQVLLLDAGGLLGKRHGDTLEQSAFVAEETARMGYQVLGVGPSDLGHGLEALRTIASDSGLRFVSANLARSGELLFPPYQVVESGGLRIGITSIYDPALDRAPWTEGIADLEVRDPAATLRALLPDLRAESDLVILYSNMSGTGTQTLLQSLDESSRVDLAIEGVSPAHLATLKRVESTYLLAANDRGKYLGQLDLLIGANGIADAVYELHELSLDLPEDAAVTARVHEFEEARSGLARSR